jgi:hypothetical protein
MYQRFGSVSVIFLYFQYILDGKVSCKFNIWLNVLKVNVNNCTCLHKIWW